MALILCSECGKEFSDKAQACPNCACPTIEIIKQINESIKFKSEESNVTSIASNQNSIASLEIEDLIPNEPDKYFQNYLRVFKDFKIQLIKEYSRIHRIGLIDSKKVVDNILSNTKWKKCNICNVDLFELDTFCINCGEVFESKFEFKEDDYDTLKQEYKNIQQLKSEFLYSRISKKEKAINEIKNEKPKEYKDSSIKCPRCGSNNYKVITGISKATSIVLFGPLAVGKVLSKFHCLDCKHNY